MRVSIKALAPLTTLLLLASCAATTQPGPVLYDPLPAVVSPNVSGSVTPAPPALRAVYVPQQPGSYDRPPQGGGYYDRPVPPHLEGGYSPAKTGRLSFLFGRRELDEAFAPAEDPGVFGMEFSNIPHGTGFGYEFGFQFGYDEAKNQAGIGDLEVSQGELYAGLRAELSPGPVRPYIGLGGTWIRTDTTIRMGGLEASENDDDFGFYAHGGIQADITESFFIGVDYRAIFDTTYSVDGIGFDGDYKQLTLVLGLSF